jgi:hypothetical protein
MNKELLLDDLIKEKAKAENIALPEDLNIKIRETLNNLPDRRKGRSKILKKTVTAAVLTLAVLTGLVIAFPTYAHNVPFVGSAFQFLSGNNIIDREYVEYSSEVNVSQTSKNIKITINSIVFDGIDLSIGYTVESKKEFKREPSIFANELKIDGKTTGLSANGTGDFVDKHTYVGVDNYHLGNLYLPQENKGSIDSKIPDNLMVDFNIRTLFDGTKGNWDFKFDISTDKLIGKVKQVKASVDLSIIGSNLKVDEVIFTPVNTVIRSTTDNVKEAEIAKYVSFDDKGRGLPEKSASKIHLGDADKIYWQHNFKSIYEDAKSATFIPITLTKENKEKMQKSQENYKYDSKEVSLNLYGTTILSEGSFGEYKIDKIELLEDKTYIHYESTKYLPAMSHNEFVIKDESDKIYNLRNIAPIEQGSNKFIAELEPLSKDKKYILSAVDLEKLYDIREDLKFTVEIK